MQTEGSRDVAAVLIYDAIGVMPRWCEHLDWLGIDYSQVVCLFQSRFFEDRYPEDDRRFNNVTYIDAVNNDRKESLYRMRRRLFSAY
ncbi:MAG: hypothetical protein ACI8QT_001976 [Halioglobus sp.]